MYKYLVNPFRERIGIPLTDTRGLACPFCPQEFRSSNVLRHHYRMHHKNIVIGNVESSTHEESSVQQDFVHLLPETCVQLDDSNRPKMFPCQTCSKVYNTKDKLRRHIKGIHTEPSPGDLKCTFCDRCTFKNVRVRKEHEKYCSRNPGYNKISCTLCAATFVNDAKLKGHIKRH